MFMIGCLEDQEEDIGDAEMDEAQEEENEEVKNNVRQIKDTKMELSILRAEKQEHLLLM